MQVMIDTTLPLNDTEREMLTVLLGGVVPEQAPSRLVQPVEPEPVVVPAKKAVAKAKAEPVPTPEPMAEEALVEEVEPEDVGADDVTDEDLLALAVKRATEMVAGGQAAAVREALDAAGASRVRELNKDNVREFFKALS